LFSNQAKKKLREVTLPDSGLTPVISGQLLNFWYSAAKKPILFQDSVFILKSQKVWLASLIVTREEVSFWKRLSDFLPDWARQYENFELRGQKDVASNLRLQIKLDHLQYIKFFQLTNAKRVVLMRNQDAQDLVFGFETDQNLSTFLLFLTKRKSLFKECVLEGVTTGPLSFPSTPKHFYSAPLDLIPPILTPQWFCQVNATFNRFDQLAFEYPLFPNLFPSSKSDLKEHPSTLLQNCLENFQINLKSVQKDFHLKTREKCHLFDLSPLTLGPFSAKSSLSCTSISDFFLLPEVHTCMLPSPPVFFLNSCKPQPKSFFSSPQHSFYSFLFEIANTLSLSHLRNDFLVWVNYINFSIHQLDVHTELIKLKTNVLKVINGRKVISLYDKNKAKLLQQLIILKSKLH
jgi:hypothetical protein